MKSQHNPLVNVIALDDYGGLQALYNSINFGQLGSASAVVTANRAFKSIHPFMRATLHNNETHLVDPAGELRFRALYHATRFFPDQLKRKARSGYIRHRIHRETSTRSAKAVIHWNCFPLVDGREKTLILYDHGLSSIHIPSKRNVRRMRSFDAILAVSHANRRILQERWGWCPDVNVIPNPITQAIARATYQPISLDGTLDGRGRGVSIGSACRLVSFKGISSAIHGVARAVAKGFDLSYTIAGEGPERARLEHLVNALGLNDRVRFVGLVQDMPTFFKEIDIFLAPSIREPFGLAPLEALAMARPVIAADVDGHGEGCGVFRATKLVTPTVPLQDYVAEGGSDEKMPEQVYSPSLDRCVEPMAIDPDYLANEIISMSSDLELYRQLAFDDAAVVRRKHSIESYTNRLSQILSTDTGSV